MTPWWDPQNMGLVGGIGGAVIGTISGLYGAAVGILAPRGKCRVPIMVMHVSMFVLGLGVLIAGIVAVSSGQPYAVYYPLLLAGGIVSVLFAFLFPVIVIQFRQADARRLEAEQFRRE